MRALIKWDRRLLDCDALQDRRKLDQFFWVSILWQKSDNK